MVKHCCVIECKSFWYPGGPSFHKFPCKQEIYEKWKNKIPVKGNISKFTYVCSNHFTDNDYTSQSPTRQLKRDAVPSIFGQNKEANQAVNHAHSSGGPDINTNRHEHLNKANENVQNNDSVENCQTNILSNSSCKKNNQVKKRVALSDLDLSTIHWPCQKKIKILQNKIYRREQKLRKIEDVLSVLKHQKDDWTDQLENILLNKFGTENFRKELIENEIGNASCSKTKKHYSEQMIQFASTICFYSPKAYRYLRTKMTLPHESTLRKKIAETSCEPGFLDRVFTFLQVESLKSHYVKDVALIIDGMSIRSNLSVDNKENIEASDCIRGYVDYG
ncbi:THAP domain-containing protein 1-like [Chrysoperla carnea]|uniref:THAP domain-containing protein 1-like n=1 Tax=Chrysoperla carnea TaxID=189513 RepID=UPI001D078907|nr:THAP domain-containing protein 1-like [Chrysoperla carnea]